MKRNLLVLFVLFSFLLPQAAFGINGNEESAVKITEAEKKMAEAITADRLRDFLTFISSDAMAGRDTPSPGLDITAHFIAFNLKQWGFKPAGDNDTFFQKMTVKKEIAETNDLKIADKSFKYGDDFAKLGGDSIPKAGLVFVKDGWMVKSKGIDAYKGVDVKGKIVVIYSEVPSRGIAPARPVGVTDEDVAGQKGVDWADPASYAEMSGAKGIVVVMSPALEQRWPFIKRFFTGDNDSLEGIGDSDGPGGPSLPALVVNSKVASAMFTGDKDQKSETPFEMDQTLEYKSVSKTLRIPTQNVVAIWEGSDPKLKEEMVAIGAHYDHVGTNENVPGDDKIWNGADDDGSGTTGVLAIAEALHKAPKRPKRSILFVWHAGEEKGLWGSEYFNKYPTVDIAKVVAQLNIDMIGRSKQDGDTKPANKDLSGPNEVYVIGSDMMSSTLGSVTKGTNDAYMKMNYNLKYDDPKDTNRFFFRSDHFNYALNGIPVVFWFTGVHEDYHQPGDEVEKIDFEKMETISRTIFLTMWKVAELDKRPAIDKELPPELTKRN